MGLPHEPKPSPERLDGQPVGHWMVSLIFVVHKENMQAMGSQPSGLCFILWGALKHLGVEVP